MTDIRKTTGEPIHRAWMNGRKFKQKGIEHEVVEGIEQYMDGKLRNCVRFTDGKRVYSYTEEEFFDKVDLI